MGDDGLDPRLHGRPDGCELGLHAACGMLPLLGRHMTECLADVGDERDAVGASGGGTAAKQPVGTGQQDEEPGVHQLGDLGGETVIVSEAEFLDGDRIILVDDRDDTGGGEQLGKGDAGIATAARIEDVVMGEEQLGGTKPVAREMPRVGVHEGRLAHGSAGLLAGKVGGALRELQGIDSRGDGGAGNNNAGNAGGHKARDLTAESAKLRFVERAAPLAGEDACAELEDDGLLLHNSLFLTRSDHEFQKTRFQGKALLNTAFQGSPELFDRLEAAEQPARLLLVGGSSRSV